MAMERAYERRGDLLADVDPSTVADDIAAWEHALNKVTEDVMAIQMQLSEDNRLGSDGTRQCEADYQQWRRRARFALHAKVAEQRALKQMVREGRRILHQRGQADSRVSEVVPAKDVPGLCMALVRTATLMKRQLECLSLSVALDGEMAALLPDLYEDLAELRQALPRLGLAP